MYKSYNEYYNDFMNSIKIKSNECYYVCNEKPEKIAFEGKCSFFVPSYMIYNIKGYKSKIFNNPTYKDVFNLCDEITEKTGNINNIFFKDIEPYEEYEEIMNNKEPFKNQEKIYNIEILLIGMSEAFDDYKDNNDIEIY